MLYKELCSDLGKQVKRCQAGNNSWIRSQRWVSVFAAELFTVGHVKARFLHSKNALNEAIDNLKITITNNLDEGYFWIRLLTINAPVGMLEQAAGEARYF